MMGIETLIKRLNQYSQSLIAYKLGADFADVCMDAAAVLSTLQTENAEMQKQLNEFSEFLCRMTVNLLSKTNYTAQAMIEAAEDYQQKVCGECDLRAENEKLRAELEQVKQKYDEARDAICTHCTDIPCRGENCYWWCGPQKED